MRKLSEFEQLEDGVIQNLTDAVKDKDKNWVEASAVLLDHVRKGKKAIARWQETQDKQKDNDGTEA